MDVPLPWKQAVTVLIYKKGESSDVSNFRPIALMSCIYKLLMGIMAKRLTCWSIDMGLLSDEQKSARLTEGCFEHAYILKSIVGQAQRNKKRLSLAWLDICNAFGSVPHSVIITTSWCAGKTCHFNNQCLSGCVLNYQDAGWSHEIYSCSCWCQAGMAVKSDFVQFVHRTDSATS